MGEEFEQRASSRGRQNEGRDCEIGCYAPFRKKTQKMKPKTTSAFKLSELLEKRMEDMAFRPDTANVT